MKYSGKLTGLLLAAIIAILSIGATESAQAQTYTVCNSSPVMVTVCIWENCGGVRAQVMPCPVNLPPMQCFVWNLTPGCTAVAIDVNGTTYAILPPGVTTPLDPPNPPNLMTFGVWGPDSVDIQ